MQAILFTRTNCAGCNTINHEELSKICELEIANCDIDKEHNLARAIASDVWSFPTLVADGKHYNGAEEIIEWIKSQKS